MIFSNISIYITKYMKEDQSSFMPGRQMANLPGRMLNIINEISKQKVKAGIISVDICKAFDSVDWSTFKMIIKVLSFGNHLKRNSRSIIVREYLSSNNK